MSQALLQALKRLRLHAKAASGQAVRITAKANSNLRVEHQLYDSTATLVFKRISCLHLSCLVPLGPRNPHLCQVNGALDTDALEIVACVLAVRADGALTCRRLPTVAWNFHRGNNVPSWRRIVSAASSQYWPQVKHETILAIVLLRRMELLMLHSLHCWQLCTKAWMRGRKEKGGYNPSHTIWQHSGRLCHDKCKMPCRSEALHDRQAQESTLQSMMMSWSALCSAIRSKIFMARAVPGELRRSSCDSACA